MLPGTLLATVVALLVLIIVPARSQSPPVSCSSADGASPTSAVAALVARLLPRQEGLFQLKAVAKTSAEDTDEFTLSMTTQGTVTVEGNSAIALASGVHHYLKHFCNCSVSWSGDQLAIPSPLPRLNQPVTVKTPFPYRYYMNTCTYGYSMAWWQWERWEREIDWMALNGINFPLAFEGQEYIWLQTFLKFNVSQESLLQWFTGPAYLPWQRMGNVNALAGPLPLSWINSHAALQCKILARMRELGMQPILPGFAGHVPPDMMALFPNAQIQQLESWGGFSGTFFLNPMDDLFTSIQKEFMAAQTSLYGTNHFYNVDPFNELTPPSNAPEYLGQVSAKIYDSLKQQDSRAVWVLQGWFLHNSPGFWQPPQQKAFFTNIPAGGAIVLDLYAEAYPLYRTNNFFYGTPFIWCMLHNFGGRSGLHAEMGLVNEGPVAAFNSAGSKMLGIGLTMEAIDTNYVQYDFMLEFTWRVTSVDIPAWLSGFAQRRYGGIDANVAHGLDLLAGSAWNCSTGQMGTSASVVAARPEFNMTQVSCCAVLQLYYNPADVERALAMFLAAPPALLKSPLFRYDLTELAAQVLSNKMLETYHSFQAAYDAGEQAGVAAAGATLLEIVTDMDALLSADALHLLGTWLRDAAAWASNEQEASLYSYNARNQVTLWGPGDSVLTQYAYKLWGGLVKAFYLPRWQKFIAYVESCMAKGQPFDRAHWDTTIEEFEVSWCRSNDSYAVAPVGDTLAQAQHVYQKYCAQGAVLVLGTS